MCLNYGWILGFSLHVQLICLYTIFVWIFLFFFLSQGFYKKQKNKNKTKRKQKKSSKILLPELQWT